MLNDWPRVDHGCVGTRLAIHRGEAGASPRRVNGPKETETMGTKGKAKTKKTVVKNLSPGKGAPIKGGLPAVQRQNT